MSEEKESAESEKAEQIPEETTEESADQTADETADETAESKEQGEESTEQPKEESEEDFAPKKRVIRRRKSKKEKEHPLSSAIRLAVETGKVGFGSRKGLKNLIEGKAKLFILASNTPAAVREELAGYSKSSNISMLEFDGNNMELGSVCGKPFSVSVLSVFEAGSSNILELAKEKKK